MARPLAPLRRALPAFLPRRILLALRRDLTIGNLTERLAAVYGDRVAFRLEERSALAREREMTFNDVDQVVTRLATVLGKEGLPLGELVAVVPSNGIDFLLTRPEVDSTRLGVTGSSQGGGLTITTAAMRSEIRAAAAGDPTTFRRTVGARSKLPEIERWLSLGRSEGAVDLAARAGKVRAPMPAVDQPADTVVAVMYTSGTTGRPKGARLTNSGLLAMLSPAALQPTGLPMTLRSAVTALPVAHIMGLSASIALMLGAISNRMLAHFDAGHVLDLIENEKVDAFVGVPAMYRAMLDAGAEDRDLTSVKVWASGADVMPRVLRRRPRIGQLRADDRRAGRRADGVAQREIPAEEDAELDQPQQDQEQERGGDGEGRATRPSRTPQELRRDADLSVPRQGRRQAGQRSAPRSHRRALRERARCSRGLSQGSRRNRQGVEGRVAAHRRPRAHRAARHGVLRRQAERRDQGRRLLGVPSRGRGRDPPPSEGVRCCRSRDP